MARDVFRDDEDWRRRREDHILGGGILLNHVNHFSGTRWDGAHWEGDLRNYGAGRSLRDGPVPPGHLPPGQW